MQELPPPGDADGRTIFVATKLALTIWFRAIYLISQAKTGLSALALKRQLGGLVQIDDAFLGGELSGGKAGRGSKNKVPFIAAVEFNEKRRPIRMRMNRVSGFTTRAISSWAKNNVAAGMTVISDGLACFAGVTEAACKHIAKIAEGRKPKNCRCSSGSTQS
jgi:hypothetical protein